MRPFHIRPFTPSDLPALAELFDAELGPGFWSFKAEPSQYCQVAEIEAVLAGAAVATRVDRLTEAPGARGPVGVIRLVAVHKAVQRQGVATHLVRTLGQDCLDAGAVTLASFAWVRGGSGACPFCGVLQHLGFRKMCSLHSFYANRSRAACPACRSLPCVCSADLYVKECG